MTLDLLRRLLVSLSSDFYGYDCDLTVILAMHRMWDGSRSVFRRSTASRRGIEVRSSNQRCSPTSTDLRGGTHVTWSIGPGRRPWSRRGAPGPSSGHGPWGHALGDGRRSRPRDGDDGDAEPATDTNTADTVQRESSVV